MKKTSILLALALGSPGLNGCAVSTTSGPQPVSMPAARAALAPEYRIFYDALQDYGDWVLIEPYGYLFRPRTAFHDWRPYEAGFWAPTDAYGWVWISNEAFGWATYHYGRWAYDEFQGWVWKPGTEWAPAWVDWRANNQYVGWAPLGPSGAPPQVPGGAYVFSSIDALGSTDLAGQIRTESQLGVGASAAKPVSESVLLDGVRVPAGPSVQRIEQIQGKRLPRATIEEVLTRKPLAEAEDGDAAAPPTLDEVRRAGEQASREAKTISSKGGQAPAKLPVFRPSVRRGLSGKPGVLPAARDSVARRRPGG